MSNEFLNESVAIADRFIKTLCFVDDQPFFSESEDPVNADLDHRLNANIVTKAFAVSGKSCAFYQYQNIDEEKDIVTLARSSDVNVIDWRIILASEEIAPLAVSEEMLSSEVGDEIDDSEVDVVEQESRGRHALSLIEKIIQTDYDSPKLIIVYTAEYVADSVFRPIKDKLKELNIECEHNEDELWFQNDKVRIAIFFKPTPSGKHLSEAVKNKIVELNTLPERVNCEFAKLASGLVLNVALVSVAEVRANTFKLLGSYNKNLDPAYITHRALLPNSADAEDQLIELIGSDIKGILRAKGLAEDVREKLLPGFIKQQYQKEKYPLTISGLDKMPDLSISGEIDRTTLESVIMNGVEKTYLRSSHPMDQQITFQKNIHKSLSLTFVDDEQSARKSNIALASLTTIKPKYQVNEYLLTQGTILQEERKNNYWLCIQPKCDSVRITQLKRQFLFVKLDVSDETNFHIVVKQEDPVFLKLNYTLYYSKGIEFKINPLTQMADYKTDGDSVKFLKVDNLNMVWVAELKNDYAQSIVNKFSSELSRVGLDLSEWLRRSGKN